MTRPEHATYHLVPPPTTDAAPLTLDVDQQRGGDHAGGPGLVLARPGPGKTSLV
jgi:hypothetical protein